MGHGHGGSADHRGGRDEARPSGGGGEGGKKGRVVIKLRGLRPRAAVADGAATANGCGTTTTGGRGGGGVTLTPFGLKTIERYRQFEAELSRHATKHFAELAQQITAKTAVAPRRRLVRAPTKTARQKAR